VPVAACQGKDVIQVSLQRRERSHDETDARQEGQGLRLFRTSAEEDGARLGKDGVGCDNPQIAGGEIMAGALAVDYFDADIP